MDFCLGFLFCSIDVYFCLCASTILSWWMWLCSIVWSQEGWFLQFHFSFSKLLCLFRVFLCFHTNCEIICSNPVNNTIGSLIGIALNLQIQCNFYQITNGIFHRTRMKNFTICMETQKILNSQSNLEKEKWSWRNQPSWL